MKLTLRIFAFGLCLAATYSAANFSSPLASVSKPQLAKPVNSLAAESRPQFRGPIPTCNPANPWCSL